MAENKAIVAILLDDQSEANNFASLFNQIGFTPKCYDDLDVLWHGLNNEKVSFAIVDVKMMSKGETILKNHPKVKNEELPLVFYYSPETTPLLLSTYEILNYGLIKKSQNYAGQLKGIIKRVNQFWQYKTEERESQAKIKELEEKIKSLGTIRIYNSFLYLEFEKSFFDLVERVFESWPDIIKYSFLTIERNGKKIISPKLKGLKYLHLEEINQARTYFEGFDPLAQKDCYQMGEETLGRNFVALKITTQKKYPEILILLTVRPSLEGFGWENFEETLTYFYQMGGMDIIRKAYGEHGLYPLAPQAVSGITLYSKKPIKTIEDFKGLKVRSTGIVAEVFKKAGATPVFFPGEELYQALQTGVCDAAHWGSTSAGWDMRFQEVTKYIIKPFWPISPIVRFL